MASSPGSVRRWVGENRVLASLLFISAVGMPIRLYELGYRVFYYDEAWFGYWILKFLDHGVWQYRPILHGPFFVRINAIVFPLLGVSDFTARLVVALMGALLPLAAWLFRSRLRDVEIVALAAVLALNPILLYYARFMRKDFPLAAAMFVVFGLTVRLWDTERPRYLYAIGAALGIAFATKESVLLWLLMFAGAWLLVADHHLVRADARGRRPARLVWQFVNRCATVDRRWIAHALGAGAVFFIVVIYFYAPRAGSGSGIGLWRAIGGNPGTLPAVIGDATVGSFAAALEHWVAGGKQDHPYLPYLADTLKTVAAGAPGVSVFAILGAAHDRYGPGEPRSVVMIGVFAGTAAIVGFPIANNFPVPWSTVHAVVPLAVPAAVGVGVVLRWGWQAAHRGRVGTERTVPIRSILAAILVLGFAGAAVGTAYQTSFVAPHESPTGGDPGHEIVYYAQPPAELRTFTDAIARSASAGGDDVDVLYVGRKLVMDESAVEFPPETGAWHARMPLPWYTEAVDADVDSVRGPVKLQRYGSTPPVVVATPSLASAVREILPASYEMHRQPLDDRSDRVLVFFVET